MSSSQISAQREKTAGMHKFHSRLGDFGMNFGVALGGIFMILPFIWMVTASFKTTSEIFRPATLLPSSLNLANYQMLFTRWPFARWFLNSLIVAGATTVAVLFFCSLAGFAFSKYRFRGRTQLFLGLLGSAMIPFPILVIPLFVIVSNLGLTNSLIALILPFMAPAIGIFLMRQYMEYVPQEMLDSSRMDGASEFRIFAQIVVPIVRPGLATLAIITFLTSWNSFLWPLVVMRREVAMTLPVGMANMLTGVSAGSAMPYGPAMAAATLVCIPTVAVFLMVQRFYIEGIASGAVK